MNDCSESKKRKKKLEKHQQMKKRKLNEKHVAVKQDHAAGQLAATGNINTLYLQCQYRITFAFNSVGSFIVFIPFVTSCINNLLIFNIIFFIYIYLK